MKNCDASFLPQQQHKIKREVQRGMPKTIEAEANLGI
jgi:hypothetical protein